MRAASAFFGVIQRAVIEPNFESLSTTSAIPSREAMTPSSDAEGQREPDLTAHIGPPVGDAAGSWDSQSLSARLYSFRFTYGAIAVLILLYIFTIRSLETYLRAYFGELTAMALTITDLEVPVAQRISYRINVYNQNSIWTSIMGVRVATTVIGRDGASLIYVAGRAAIPPPERYELASILAEAERLLPATAHLSVSIPHNSLLANSILIFYAVLTMQALWIRNRVLARRQRHLLEQSIQQREASEYRTRKIQSELDQARGQFQAIEPSEPEHLVEVKQLRHERKGLEEKLVALETRELELRETASRNSELGQEITALEELLEEASEDLASRQTVIQELEKSAKRASKGAASQESVRARESETLGRRFSVLYKNLEIDDRAIHDIVALRDEAMKLKCEEKLKRLNDEADKISVRRKVGGIPPHLTIFEMGFAGKGRLYYMKGSQRRFRVLNVGAKNTQNASIEYLRKL